jgi:hypothetical protein
VTGRLGEREKAFFGLAKESGSWKISSITVGGTDLSGDSGDQEPDSESQ